MEGKYISSEEVSDLSSIPSRVELLSKLLFLLSSPLTNLASALQSPVRGLLSLLGQLEGKSGEAAKAAEKTPAEEEAPVETADAVEEGESLNQEVEEGKKKTDLDGQRAKFN